MGDIVSIKGNRYGLTIHLEETSFFDNLYEQLKEKLIDGKKFFGNSKVSIQFEGYSLTHVEEEKLVELIQEVTDLSVYCIVDEDMPVAIPEEFLNQPKEVPATPQVIVKEPDVIVKSVIPKEAAIFHYGTMRSGQEIEVDSGIVIIGDVNPGAKVTAKGNVVVLGKLKGYAHAGADGASEAYIFAMKMQPTQIRVGDLIARAPDRFDHKEDVAEIAFIEKGQIVIDTVDRQVYKNLQNLHE